MGFLNHIFKNSKLLAKRHYIDLYIEMAEVKVTVLGETFHTTYGRLCYILIDNITSDIKIHPGFSYDFLSKLSGAIKPGVYKFIEDHVYEINTDTLAENYSIDLNELGLITSIEDEEILYQTFKSLEFMENKLDKMFEHYNP